MKFIYVFLYWFFLISIPLSAVTGPLAQKRFPVKIQEQTCPVPYESTHDLAEKNEMVERAIFAIHSSNYNVKMVYDNVISAMKTADIPPQKYLLIAPHFLSEAALDRLSPKAEGQKFLMWKPEPFWGTSVAVYNGQPVSISSYDVTDQMLGHIVTSSNFPNLKTIVILGHSAGGQMVNRYAAGNCFEPEIARPRNITVKYLVMAPSTHVYFTPERFTRTPNPHFEDPKNPPANFNTWGCGMDKLYVYHRRHRITPEMMRKNYAEKTILYLVGQQDKNPDDKSMSRTEAAMMQGCHRLERGRIYFDYLLHLFGPEIKNNQRFMVVRNVGHSGRGLMCSFPGRQFIFGDWNLTAEKGLPTDTESVNLQSKKQPITETASEDENENENF